MSIIIYSQRVFLKKPHPFFFFKNAAYGEFSNTYRQEVERSGLQLAFVTDVKYHEKTVFFLKHFSSYTIGVVPLNMNP